MRTVVETTWRPVLEDISARNLSMIRIAITPIHSDRVAVNAGNVCIVQVSTLVFGLDCVANSASGGRPGWARSCWRCGARCGSLCAGGRSRARTYNNNNNNKNKKNKKITAFMACTRRVPACREQHDCQKKLRNSGVLTARTQLGPQLVGRIGLRNIPLAIPAFLVVA